MSNINLLFEKNSVYRSLGTKEQLLMITWLKRFFHSKNYNVWKVLIEIDLYPTHLRYVVMVPAHTTMTLIDEGEVPWSVDALHKFQRERIKEIFQEFRQVTVDTDYSNSYLITTTCAEDLIEVGYSSNIFKMVYGPEPNDPGLSRLGKRLALIEHYRSMQLFSKSFDGNSGISLREVMSGLKAPYIFMDDLSNKFPEAKTIPVKHFQKEVNRLKKSNMGVDYYTVFKPKKPKPVSNEPWRNKKGFNGYHSSKGAQK